MKLIITGGRSYADFAAVKKVLDCFHSHGPIEEIVQGARSGADSMAEIWARQNSVTTRTY